MRFPNAASGVKKIFTAEILALISEILLIIAGFMVVVALAATNTNGNESLALGTLAGFAIFGFGATVIAVIAFILKIVGISQASKDENSFKTAIICLIIGIVGSLVYSIFQTSSPTVASIGNLIYQLMNLFVTIFVISGIIKLADQLNDGVVSAKGSTLLKLITVIYALTIIANIIVLILGGYAVSIVAAIIYLIALILTVVQYIMYLVYLANAKKMLAEN
nr:hypothetical protein [uncultured Ruminococcus sp.]